MGCYRKYQDLQESFPGKLIFIPPLPLVRLPETGGSSQKDEKDLARKVLTELNATWEGKFEHLFSVALPQYVPETQLSIKKSRAEKERQLSTEAQDCTTHHRAAKGKCDYVSFS